MRKLFFNFSRKIDECCDSILNSFGISIPRWNLNKYYPWAIFLLVVVFHFSITYFVWAFFIPCTYFFYEN